MELSNNSHAEQTSLAQKSVRLFIGSPHGDSLCRSRTDRNNWRVQVQNVRHGKAELKKHFSIVITDVWRARLMPVSGN